MFCVWASSWMAATSAVHREAYPILYVGERLINVPVSRLSILGNKFSIERGQPQIPWYVEIIVMLHLNLADLVYPASGAGFARSQSSGSGSDQLTNTDQVERDWEQMKLSNLNTALRSSSSFSLRLHSLPAISEINLRMVNIIQVKWLRDRHRCMLGVGGGGGNWKISSVTFNMITSVDTSVAGGNLTPLYNW